MGSQSKKRNTPVMLGMRDELLDPVDGAQERWRVRRGAGEHELSGGVLVPAAAERAGEEIGGLLLLHFRWWFHSLRKENLFP